MTKKVDILLKFEEVSSNGTRATREARLVKIDTKSTTLGRLKDMARFQLSIQGDLELWLLHDDGARPMNLRHTDPISKFITKDSTIQVEKLDVRNRHDYPSSAFATCNAFPTTPQSLAFAGKESQRGDEEIARLLSLQFDGTRENLSIGMRYASPPFPPSVDVAGKEIERGDEEVARLLSLQFNDTRENRSKGMLYASSPTPPSAAFDRKECERGDEEMARLLSMQLNGMHVNPPKQMLLPPPRPLGDMIARASFSQFAIEGGRSACTSICLYAAAQLLDRIAEGPSCITTSVLDGYLQVGTLIYTDLYLQHGDHTSLDDLWNHPIYSDIVQPLQRRTVIHGTTSRRSFQECLGEARTYAHCHDEKSVAVVLTKPPETILLICKDVHQGAPWFLFDSHGHQYENPKKAFVVQFGSLQTAAAALLEKFPNIEGLGDTLHAQQMNMFEAHAIVRKPQVNLKESRFSTPSRDGSALMQVGQQLHLQDSVNVKVLDNPLCRGKGQTHEKLTRAHGHSRDFIDGRPFADVFSDTSCPHAKLPDSQAHYRDSCTEEGFVHALEEPCADAAGVPFGEAVFCDKGYPHEGFPDLREHYQDPTTGELLADPVICDRGHTHERVVIERHFAARREMKAEEEERLRQKQGSPITAEETCNAQRNFDPTCPLTGEAISDILIDNDQCDRMVQLLVESGQIPLEDGELEDWRERRMEKARLAQERRAQLVAQSTLQSTKESSQHESNPTSVVSINSNTVMIMSQSYNRAGHFHLGVAVALCPSDWERPVREQVSIPRCGNSCCRTRLQTMRQDACARCTQILCSDCLVFHVKEATPRVSYAVDDDHSICPECVTQILHVLGTRSATELGTDESRLMEKIDDALKQFFASLMEQKAELQHQVLQYRVHQSYATDAEALSQRIEELLQERATLENQIRLAQEQANAAKTDRDDSASETNLPPAGKASITNQIRRAQEQAGAAKTVRDESALQKELLASDSPTADEVRLQIRISEIRTELDEIDWTTEEGMIRGSLLEHQHNEAMVDLGVAMSLRLNETNLGEQTAGSEETTQHIKDMECRCAAVMAEHDALVDEGPFNEHDDVFGMKVSELMHRYDQLSMELTQAKEDFAQRQQSRAVPVPGVSSSASSRATREDKNETHGFLGLTFASSLTRIIFKPFTSGRTASHSDRASRTSKAHAGDASSGDVMASSNHATARIEVEEVIELILPSLNAATAEIAISDLAAIGTIGVEEFIALPLDLHYPSDRIRHQVLVLRNNLELARLESERALEECYGSLRQQLLSRVESLEDELVTLHREVACAQATAEKEERLRQERMARRAAAEQRRKRLEEERAAEAERLRQEQERLEAARRKQEEATRQSLQGLDLRRCGNPSCGYGPFEKYACVNMAAHNDEFTYIDSNGRRQKRRRNECPQCKWTHPDWRQWPKFNALA